MPTPFSNTQPAIALTIDIDTQGTFHGDASSLGSIHHYAFNFNLGAPLDGQILSIAQYTALFSLMGTTYGGNGTTNFALPDLSNTLSIGENYDSSAADIIYQGEVAGSDLTELSPYVQNSYVYPASNVQESMGTQFFINVFGSYPNGLDFNTIGLVWQSAEVYSGNYPNALPCEGQLLSIADYEALFNLIGTTFGGDGQETFALPDLRGRTIVGADSTHWLGDAFGSDTLQPTLSNLPVEMGGGGQPMDNHQPSLALNYIINLQGVFPSQGAAGSQTPVMGEIVAFAGSTAPQGWAFCSGQLLPINQNQALFSLLGTTYGGNGQVNFALPDLRGRAIVDTQYGQVGDHGLGEVSGQATVTLTLDNIPSVYINDDDTGHTLYGANDGDAIYGNGGNDTLIGYGGNDYLNGGTGADTMVGGTGDDIFVVDDAGDVITELANQGTDRVITDFAVYSLASLPNVEDLTGGNADQALTGNDSDNRIDGAGGADVMTGGLGNDTYVVDDYGDQVVEALNAGTDTVQSSIDYALGSNVENLTLTGSDAVYATGNALANTIIGNDADNYINGASGADAMAGGLGDDTYVIDNVGDSVVESVGAGIDGVRVSFSYSLGANIENGELTGTASVNLTGNALGNFLEGNSGNNRLNGGAGSDQMAGHEGNDTYVVDNAGDVVVEDSGQGTDTVEAAVSYTLSDAVENLTLTGTGTIDGTGNVLENVIVGNSAANIINGGGGADSLSGGDGDDSYYVDGDDVVTENVYRGIDTVYSSAFAYTLTSNVENLVLTVGAATGTGNALDNVLTGNDDANQLTGGGGTDTMVGHGGNDVYYVAETADVVVEAADDGTDTVHTTVSYTLSANVENLVLDNHDIDGTGNDGDNTITGNMFDNVIDGGAGADTMAGGGGDDRYVVDNVGDAVTESADAGNDTVVSSIAYVLGDNIENLILTGSASINGNGNALDNVLTGNDGNNLLNGLGGADVMLGGLGDDSYYVDNANDVIVENAGEGLDLVRANVSVSLSDNVENLILYGTGDIYGVGNSSANTMIGNNGANLLDGGAGADYLRGGYGDDTYVVDNSGDKVVEGVGGGYDRVQSSINYTLGSYVEDLLLTGTAAINGSGNALDNNLTGNGAANTLNGGLGADTLAGGDGNDIYLVDNSGDTVIEHAGEGLDLVKSTASFVLGANIENLLLYGTGAIDGTGNDLANSIVGNAAANRLDGGAGADYLRGGAGNDTYVVDNAGDKVVEGIGAGTDSVEASINYTLGSYVENLTLTGSNEINGTGNTLDNIILGNGADNILKGGAGSDVLNGGGGSDVLTGGTGNDTFLFDAGLWAGNVDQITDFSVGSDIIGLSQSIFALTSNGGHLAAGEFVAGTAALDADDHIIYDSVTGNLYYDADGNGGSDQILFAHVTAGAALTHNDFMIVG